MSTDVPGVERVPSEGPTYRMRLDAAVAAVADRKRAGIGPATRVVCARQGHKTQPEVAEVWIYGNDVLWRSEHPARRDADALLGVTMRSLEHRGIDWKAAGVKFQDLAPKYVNAHLLNVPPNERVDSTEHDGITADADGNTAPGWHTSAWPGGPEVAAHCPTHGALAVDEVVILAAAARGTRRVLLT